jgi:hypothetical protein
LRVHAVVDVGTELGSNVVVEGHVFKSVVLIYCPLNRTQKQT